MSEIPRDVENELREQEWENGKERAQKARPQRVPSPLPRGVLLDEMIRVLSEGQGRTSEQIHGAVKGSWSIQMVRRHLREQEGKIFIRKGYAYDPDTRKAVARQLNGQPGGSQADRWRLAGDIFENPRTRGKEYRIFLQRGQTMKVMGVVPVEREDWTFVDVGGVQRTIFRLEPNVGMIMTPPQLVGTLARFWASFVAKLSKKNKKR